MRFPPKVRLLRIFRRLPSRRKISFALRATAWSAAIGYLVLALAVIGVIVYVARAKPVEEPPWPSRPHHLQLTLDRRSARDSPCV